MAKIFENLDIPYLVAGQLPVPSTRASATQDIDMVAELKNHHIQALIANTKNAFYIEEKMLFRAVSRHSSFNVIHLETMIKVDIFVPGSEAIDREEMRRRKAADHCWHAIGRGNARGYCTAKIDLVSKRWRSFRPTITGCIGYLKSTGRQVRLGLSEALGRISKFV